MANNYNFVKFLRGSQSAYDRLQVHDINTLYFIYDSQDTTSGKLYLGDYLINDGSISNIALSNLSDVDMGTLTGTEILRYNSTLSKWQPVLVSDLLVELDIVAGAAVVNSGITKQAGETDADALARAVSVKKEGDLAIVDGTVYVYDDNSWLKLIDSSVTDTGVLADRVDDIETALDNIYTKAETDSAIATAVASANHLTYTTVGSLDGLDPTATTSQNKVYLVTNSSGESGNAYDEFMAINGAWEKIGKWSVDLTGYVQTNDPRLLTTTQVGYLNNLFDNNGQISINSISDLPIKSVDSNSFTVTAAGQLQLNAPLDLSNYVLKTTVGDLSNLTHRSSANSTIVDELNALADRLIWKPIEE